MIEFGLAAFNFSDPLWRRATFEEVQQTNASMSALHMKFLHDFTPAYRFLSVGEGILESQQSNILLSMTCVKPCRAGSLAVFESDGVATRLDTMLASNGRVVCSSIHMFAKESSAKRRKTTDKRLGAFLWRDRSFPDAVVTCDQVRFDVHRAVLVQNPVFKQGLSGSMVEARTAEFDIKDSQPDAVEALLRHIYTGETDTPKSALVPLLALAVQYQEADLVQAVALALTDVSPDTVQAHGRALKLHRGHPDVDVAYKKLREIVCKDENLVDRLL